MADRVGERFGDYQLKRFLGQGTFGDVYLGEHLYQHTQAAVKVFKTKLTPDKLKDFINEVRTVLLQHPNIVRILDFGIGEHDIAYLVMEYAPNGTLLQRHPRGTLLPLATVVSYVKQIAAALQYAHDQRRIHRDVKPENMFFGAHHEVLLGDFGIAAVAHNPSSQRTEDSIGTALYMAPEQWQGKPLPATDQYALGVVVYEWLCGECPFSGDLYELMHHHKFNSPPPLHAKLLSVPAEMEQVVLTALAKDPKDRFASVQTFADVLERAYVRSQQATTFQQSPANLQAQVPTVSVKGQPPTFPMAVTSRQRQPMPPAYGGSAATRNHKAKIRRQQLTGVMGIVVAFVLWAAGTTGICGINYFLMSVEGNQGLNYSNTRGSSITGACAIEVIIFLWVYVGAQNEFESSWLSLVLAGLSTEGVIWVLMWVTVLIDPPPPTMLDWQVLSYTFYATLAIGVVYAIVAIALGIRERRLYRK